MHGPMYIKTLAYSFIIHKRFPEGDILCSIQVGKFTVKLTLCTWGLCDGASLVQWYQQPTRCNKMCFIDYFKLALHRLDGTSNLCHRSAADIRVGTLFRKAVYTVKLCSWRWTKMSPETCRASLKDSIKHFLLHLVVCWYHCIVIINNMC